jgi:molecular chaperone IbpA
MDFTPYRRSLIGFDNVFDLMENASRIEQLNPFPPYDIEQHGEDAYRIRLAVAGYTADEIDVTWHQDVVLVTGRKEAEPDDRKFLYRGIAASGGFERQFQLAPHVIVTGANLADGILEIDLKVEIPEAAKPKKIELGRRAGAKRVAKTVSPSTADKQSDAHATNQAAAASGSKAA